MRSERSASSAAVSSATAASAGGRRCASTCAERRGGLVEAAEQQQPARRDQPRLQRVGAVGARLERGRRRRQRARRAAEVAHGQRHLGLGHDAAGARHLLVRAEPARGASQQLARARVLAELRHGDAAQRQRRWVVAQRDALERAERVAGGERARGGGDQGVHAARLSGAVAARCRAVGRETGGVRLSRGVPEV